MSGIEDPILNTLCEEGKEITVGLTIVDSDLALKLMGTMYDKNVSQFGVKVNRWYFFDIEKAYKKREELIAVEMDRHITRMSELIDPNLLSQLLEEDDNEKTINVSNGDGRS